MAFESEPQTDEPPVEVFTVSVTEIISRTFKVWMRKILSYVIIVGALTVFLIALDFAIAIFFPGVIYAFNLTDVFFYITAMAYGGVLADPTSFLTFSLLIILTGLVINALVSGGAIQFALDDYGFKKADVAQSISRSFSKFVSLFLVLLIVGLLQALILGPLSYFTLMAIDIETLAINMDAFNAMMGLFVFAIVLVYINIRIIPTLAVIMAEDRSAIDAFKRSFELTSGHFMHILASYILMILAVAVLDLVIALFVGAFIASIINLIVLASMHFVYQAVLYRDLQSRTVTSEQLTEWW